MNKQLAFAATAFAALCAVSSAARADDQNRPLTREEVVAQVLAARQSGELAALETGSAWKGSSPAAAPLSREEVVASVLAARQSGELAAIETGSPWNRATGAPAADRDQVIAEFMKTRQPSDALALEHSL